MSRSPSTDYPPAALDIMDPQNPSAVSALVTAVETGINAGSIISPVGNCFFALDIAPPADNANGTLPATDNWVWSMPPTLPISSSSPWTA